MSQPENDLLIFTLLRSDRQREIEDGVSKLTRLVHSLIYKFVTRNSGSNADAADLEQEVVLTVYLQIRNGSYTPMPDKPLKAYVSVIIRNQWFKVLRQRRYQKEELLPPDIPVDETSGSETDTERVEKAVNLLGKTCQQILKDYYFKGIPLHEIADELKKSYAAVKEQKYRRMQQLKSLLSPPSPSAPFDK